VKRFYKSGLLSIITQGPAEFLDARCQGGITYRNAGPNGAEEFLLAYDLARTFG
jgi:hypothetical protein